MSLARACGKVILLGEHFVVPHADNAEAPALAFPLRGLSCEVEVTKNGLFSAHGVANDNGCATVQAIHTKMARALEGAADVLRLDARGLGVRSRATFPLSRGFGSSAAFSVALTRALDGLASSGSARDLGVVAHAVETVFHGAPSGLDTAVILAERAVRFHRGRVVRYVQSRGVELVVVDSGPREGAASLIARIRDIRTNDSATWSRLSARITDLVDRCENALGVGHATAVGAIAGEAHAILAGLGLSAPRIESVIAEGIALGALGGKVSGAGAGGAVVLVAREGEGERLARSLSARGHSVVAVAASSETYS